MIDQNNKNEQNNQQNQPPRDDPFAASDIYGQTYQTYQTSQNDPYAQYFNQNKPRHRSTTNHFTEFKDGKTIFLTVLKALLFVLLFVAIQNLVVLAAEIPITVYLTLQGITSEEELLARVIEILSPYLNYLSALSGLLTVIAVFVIFACRKKNPFKELSFNKTKVSTIIICIFAGIALNFSCNILFMFMPPEWMTEYTQASEGLDTGSLLSYILGGVIMAPITEEIIFRGAVMKRCAKCMPAVFASLVAAVVFGICHGNLVWAIYAGTLGFIIGLIFARFDSIIPCIVLHLSFNSVSAIQRVVMDLPAIQNMSESQELIFNAGFTILSYAMLAVSVALVTILMTSEKLLVTPKNTKEEFSVNE